MANIKWSGIESSKYGLTARWYVSAYYGNDVDVDGAGYYNPSTNVTGHGGPTRPFATLSKLQQDSNIVSKAIVIIDSGYYYLATGTKRLIIVGDGSVILELATSVISSIYNCSILRYIAGASSFNSNYYDSIFLYMVSGSLDGTSNYIRCTFIESILTISSTPIIENCNFINCTGTIGATSAGLTVKTLINSIFINCNSLVLRIETPRPAGYVIDYNVLIGTIGTSISINGKTSGVTVEDFKINGNYFVKSFSEVDLFGNVSGSGASVAQLQTIFNNYFSPIYLDTYQYSDLSLKTTTNEKVRYGGLNGIYIGMCPVGYHFSAATLWANRNITNTVDIEVDAITGYLQIVSGAEFGTYESNEIDLGTSIIVDPVLFRANLIYNSDGTAKQGVANQRIDTNPDALPNNTLNQRVVYDYQLAWSPDNVQALSAFKNFELNRKPTVDGEGDTQLDDNYNSAAAQSITIRRLKFRAVLRKIVIE